MCLSAKLQGGSKCTLAETKECWSTQLHKSLQVEASLAVLTSNHQVVRAREARASPGSVLESQPAFETLSRNLCFDKRPRESVGWQLTEDIAEVLEGERKHEEFSFM